MKTNKLWSILMMFVLVLGVAIAFSSCNKDDDETHVSLVGKTYAAYAYQGGGTYFLGSYIPPYDVYWVYRFTSSTQCERTARENNPQGKLIGDAEMYTYVLDYPTIQLKSPSGTITTGTFITTSSFRIKDREYNLQK